MYYWRTNKNMNRLVLAAEIDQNKKQIIVRINAIASYFNIVVNPLAICDSMMKVLNNDDIEDTLDSLDTIVDYVKKYNIKDKYPFQYNRQVKKIKIILSNLGNEQKAKVISEKLFDYAVDLDRKYFTSQPVSDDVIKAQESVAVINEYINVLRVIFTQEELKEISKFSNSQVLAFTIDKQISLLVSIRNKYPNNQQINQYINNYKMLFLSAIKQNDLANNTQQRNKIIDQIKVFDQESKQKNLDNKLDNYKINIANKFNQIGQLVNVSLASIIERLNATFEKEHINYSHVAGEDSSNISMALAKITNKYIPIVTQALKSDAVNRAIDNYSKMPNIRPYTLEMIFYTPRSLIDKFRLAYSAKSLLKTWLENFQLNNNYFFIFESIVRSLNRILNREIELDELDESALQWLGLEKDKVMQNILTAGLNKVAQKAIFNKLNILYESHNAYDIVLKQITTDDYKDLKDYKQLVIRYFTNIPDLRNKEYRYSPQKLVPILNQMVSKYKTKLRNVNLDTTEEELEERRKLEQNWLNEYSQYIPPTAIDYFQNKIYPIRNAKIVGKDGTLFDFDAFIEQCKKLYNANKGNKRKDVFEAFFRGIERNFSEAIKEWKEADTESRTHSKRIQYLNELGKRYSLTHEGAAFIEEHSKDPYLDYFNAINVWAVTYYDHSNEIKSLIQSTADQALAQILSYLNQTNEEFKRMNIPPVTKRLPDYIKGCGCTLLKPELVNSFDGIVNTQKQEYAAQNKPFDGFNVVKFFCNIVVGLSGDKVQVDNSWMRKNFGRETELLPKEIQEEYKRYRKRQNTEDASSISDFEPPKSQTPEELRTPKEKKNKDPWAGSFTGPKPEGGSEYFQKQKVRKNQNNGRGDVWVDQTSLKSLEQNMRIDQWKAENNKIGKKYNRLLRHIFG